MLICLEFGLSLLLVNASALACLEVGAPVLVCFEYDLSSLLGANGLDIAFLDCLGVYTSVLVCLEA